MAESSNLCWQHQLILPPMARGFHCIDAHVESLIQSKPQIAVGMVNLFLQHTSASLVITENCCTDVKKDLQIFYDQLAPDSTTRYNHNLEGPDDMPAHIKSTILGVSLTLPIQNGRLALGQWQGIYLGEHRDIASQRKIMVTAYGHNPF